MMKPIKIITPVFLLFFFFSAFAQKNYYLLAGTYTSSKSIGIYVYNFNSQNGSVKIVDSIKTPDPSYVTVSPNQKFVYAVNEEGKNNGHGKITSFSFNKNTGHLTELNQQPSMGDDPCYVTVDKTGKWVIVGNYSSGTIAVFPVLSNGSLAPAVTTVQHKGHGVNMARQQGPHVHETMLSKNNKYLFVPDLGMDKIMIYLFNDKTGKLSAAKQPFIKLKDGSGPRHFDFHPSGKWAYLIQEMGETITAFKYNNGTLATIQIISALPKNYYQPSTGAEIFISRDGRFLYASNRDSSNTITIFKINQQTGKLTLLSHQSSLGKTPRNFNLDPSGNYLLVANQNSDNIVVFKVNKKTGLITATGRQIKIGNPVCIKWIEKQ